MSQEYVNGWNAGVASINQDALRREGMMLAFDIAMDRINALLTEREALAESEGLASWEAKIIAKAKCEVAIEIAKAINEARKALGATNAKP